MRRSVRAAYHAIDTDAAVKRKPSGRAHALAGARAARLGFRAWLAKF
jgi:hypothetical protein